MKKLFIILTLIIYTITAANASGTFSISHHTSSENLTYELPITEEFKNAFTSALKTGKVVSIVHTIKIRPVDQWLGWMAEKKYTKYYKYNLINNQYYIGVKKDKLRPVASIKYILKSLAVLNNVPFLPKNVLQKQKAYEINFEISINPIQEEQSSKLLLFKGDSLKERLRSAVHYIYQ